MPLQGAGNWRECSKGTDRASLLGTSRFEMLPGGSHVPRGSRAAIPDPLPSHTCSFVSCAEYASPLAVLFLVDAGREEGSPQFLETPGHSCLPTKWTRVSGRYGGLIK